MNFDLDFWMPLFIFLARATDVSIGTVRVICVLRGQRLAAVVLSFFEVLIWTFAVASVITRLDNFLNFFAFAGGFATGCALGMSIEQYIALGTQRVSMISRQRSTALAQALRDSGLRVTTMPAAGRDGPLEILMTVIARRQTRAALRLAREVDPTVKITIEDVCETTFHIVPGVGPARTRSWRLSDLVERFNHRPAA